MRRLKICLGVNLLFDDDVIKQFLCVIDPGGIVVRDINECGRCPFQIGDIRFEDKGLIVSALVFASLFLCLKPKNTEYHHDQLLMINMQFIIED